MKPLKKKQKPSEMEQEPVESLSYEELTMLRAGIEKSAKERGELPPHNTSDTAHLFRYARKNKLLTAAVIVIVAALLAAIAFGIYAFVSWLSERPNRSDFTVILGENDPYTVEYRDAVRDGVLYVDMRQIAEFTDMIISTGKETRLKITASGGTYLRFENGSNIAVINGERVAMKVKNVKGKEVDAVAIVNKNECLVPYLFLEKSVSDGMIFRLNNETNTIKILHIHYMQDNDRENAVAAEILFDNNSFDLLPSLTDKPEYTYSYRIDIEPYLDSMTAEYLLLANKSNPLLEDYAPSDLVRLTCATDGESQQLRADAAMALYAMMAEMAEDGVDDVYVTSSYRSYTYQDNLYWGYVQKHMNSGMTQAEAEAAASAYSARPGESEHQTGLCLDFTTESIHGAVDEEFEETAAYTWLSQNAYRFGFILRYPTDKVTITQYDYEPWHYRFVGREAATEIYFGDLCLEEYLGEDGE